MSGNVERVNPVWIVEILADSGNWEPVCPVQDYEFREEDADWLQRMMERKFPEHKYRKTKYVPEQTT